jgi:DNA-binding LytR/AlgR family response regulator
MHIAVCDDDQNELSRVSSLLEDYRRERGGYLTYETFHSATELLETMRSRRYDLLLLDIFMPGVTGMEAAGEIRLTDGELPIVFLTSSREFAVESYRVNAEDYLLKPARQDTIFSLLDRLFARLCQEDPYLTLKTEGSIIRLPLSRIVSVEVRNRMVAFTLADGTVRETYGNLADFEEKLLAHPAFCKPHRAYLVNLALATGLDKDGFTTPSGKRVPVARDSFARVKAAYMKALLSGGGMI